MDKTPVKQITKKDQLCITCGKKTNEPRRVESTKSKYNIRELLQKYVGIIIEAGIICRTCLDRINALHRLKTQLFYNQCQENYKKHLLHGKRMSSTPPDSSKPQRKRRDTKQTPSASHASTSGLKPSRIPTPTSQSKRFRRKEVPDQYVQSRKRLFSNDTLPEIIQNDTAVGMEVEIQSDEPNGDVNKPFQSHLTDHVRYGKQFETSSSKQQTGDQLYACTSVNSTKQTKKTKASVRKSYMQPLDHDYIQSQKKPPKFNLLYENIWSFVKEYRNSNEKLSVADHEKLRSACKTGDTSLICTTLLGIDSLRKSIIEKLCVESDQTMSTLTRRKYNTSVLMQKSTNDLKSFDWFSVVDEFKTKFPDLFMQTMAIMVNRESGALYTKIEAILPRLGTIYGIMLQGRNQELSLVQRLNALLLFDNICDVKVYDRFQRQGLCLGYEGTLKLLGTVGGRFNDSLIDLIRKRNRFRIIGDNINWTVGVHDQRIDHTTVMQHAFGSAVLVQNIDFSDSDHAAPQRNFEETPVQVFIPSDDDYAMYRHDYTILMSKVAFQYLPYFQSFEDVIPKRICQPSYDISKKTKVIPLPVLFKNEQKYQDVVEIMDFYEKILTDACREAEVNSENISIHIGGDQLTRERFSGAKCLRAHEDTPMARFEHLSPITFEFFHMHMNFLKMVFSTLYNESSVQDTGTLKSLQNRVSRTHVGENVNAHYDADKDFFISVVDVHIAECFLEYFGMEDVNAAPTLHVPPVFDNKDEKRKSYFTEIGKMVDLYVLPRTAEEQDTRNRVQEEMTVFDIPLPDGRKLTVNVPKQKQKPESPDGVQNYAKRILEAGLLFKDLLDSTKVPDRNRHISLLKLAMMLFKSHKNLSKYAYEILRLLVHQICILTEREANKEFYGLFVNTNGKIDGHIPADRQMEYLVKKVKTHIKHMYSNKTQKNIVTKTSAIASVSDIGSRYDTITSVKTRSQRHADRSSQGDELILLESIRKIKPFRKCPSRHHSCFPNIAGSITEGLDIEHYHSWIDRKKFDFGVELGN